MKIYLDTNVIIALILPEDYFHRDSKLFMEVTKQADHKIVVCRQALVFDFVLGASKKPTRLYDIPNYLKIIKTHRVKIANVDHLELLELAAKYHEESIELKLGDLIHYAASTLLQSDIMVSWDERHFNEKVARKISEINRRLGLKDIKAATPIKILEGKIR